MQTLSGDDALTAALGAVSRLGTSQDRERLSDIRDRLAAQRLRVLIAGEAKRGKSTLVNALLGRTVLPAGVTPLTAVATTVRYGGEPWIEVTFADGRDERDGLTALDDLVTERGNPGNRRGVHRVIVYVDAPVLMGGVELVDTPGTGSVYSWDTDAAYDALETMDAAIFVLTGDPPVSASERDLLRRVGELSVTTFVVLNKADRLDPEELTEASAFTSHVVAEASGAQDGPVAEVTVYPMSARAALTPEGDPGFGVFAADFEAYLKEHRAGHLRQSVAAHVRRIALSLLDEVELTRRAAQLRAGDAAQRVEEFEARLAEVTVHGRDALAVVNAESGRLLFALNDAADAAGPRLRKTVGRELDDLLEGDLNTASPADIERQGRERVVTLATKEAGRWRDNQTDQLERGLAEVDARLADDLRGKLELLRHSAAELLDLDLAVPDPGGRLTRDSRFFFSTGEDAGQTELLTGMIRRSLPGEVGRRRARDHVRQAAAELVTSQVGRARADLQYRLAEATRKLARVVEQRYADGTERMSSGLRAAAELRQASDQEAARQLSDLDRREAELRQALSLLAPQGDGSHNGSGDEARRNRGAVRH
jgi:GTP-binding protein EngB required for normal cell division